MGFIAWVVLIWGVLMIVSSFVLPFMIGRHREPYTAGTATAGMIWNISLGVMVILVAGAYLSGGAA